MSRWPLGVSDIEEALRKRDLELVPPNSDHSQRLLREATSHIASAKLIIDSDPVASFQIAYSALRKTCAALLAYQGLRATSDGGHVIVFEAVRAQFNGPHGRQSFAHLQTMRQRRNSAEYPKPDSPDTAVDDALDCIERAELVLKDSTTIIESGELGAF